MEVIQLEMYNQHKVELQRFERACEQIVQLNGKLDELSRRYKNAIDNNNKIFRYSLRSRMLVVEGMLTTYCNYANVKKQQLMSIRHALCGRSSDEMDMSEDSQDSDEE
ncbi:hypothetical protein ACF0H5_000857 [Mactra antiquata]